jgi:cob(I)alamin adenosyltransferase
MMTNESEMTKICAIITGHCPRELCTTAEAVQWLVDRHKASTAANLKLDEIRTEKMVSRGLADEASAVSAARVILRKSERVDD